MKFPRKMMNAKRVERTDTERNRKARSGHIDKMKPEKDVQLYLINGYDRENVIIAMLKLVSM